MVKNQLQYCSNVLMKFNCKLGGTTCAIGRWCVMSQCDQASNVVKNQPQYCVNGLMKLNCKPDGTTCAIKAVRNSLFFKLYQY